MLNKCFQDSGKKRDFRLPQTILVVLWFHLSAQFYPSPYQLVGVLREYLLTKSKRLCWISAVCNRVGPSSNITEETMQSVWPRGMWVLSAQAGALRLESPFLKLHIPFTFLDLLNLANKFKTLKRYPLKSVLSGAILLLAW